MDITSIVEQLAIGRASISGSLAPEPMLSTAIPGYNTVIYYNKSISYVLKLMSAHKYSWQQKKIVGIVFIKYSTNI